MPAIALTDNGNMYGAIEFYQACQKEGIKPIIGIDAYVAPRTRHDRQAGVDSKRIRLVLLAKNEAGYKNLIKLVTESHMTGFYYKPRIDAELIEKYHEGLICISPSFSGDIIQALKMSDEEKAGALVAFYKKTYGPENFFIEITHHPEIEGHEERMTKLVAFARSTNTPIVAAHDVYYLNPDDRKAREVLMSIMNGGEAKESGGFDDSEEDFSFLSPEEIEKRFADTPDAVENTMKIADMCDLKLELGKWYFPNFIIEPGKTHDEVLRERVFKGIEEKGLEKTEDFLKRVEYELLVIKNKGYSQYFLVVSDLLHYARTHGIYTTIRGSVAGSLVTYLAGITNVNPLEYKLPFERFLNPERPSAPDIDMDYADNRRDEMHAYAKEKYGADKFAQIGTFGTMMARGAVRDTARAMGFPYAVGDQISKLIPMGAQGFPMTIDIALDTVPELKDLYSKDNNSKTILDMARKIEGCARHISIHAAGVVIAPQPLTEFVPLQFDPKGGKIITQYDMHGVGEDGVGLLKFDFLGIRNLAILADAVKMTKKIYNVDVDIEKIPLNDQKTFDMLARGETVGLFQLNGAGMTKHLIDLKPSSIHDINAMVALYRPGPMESIPEYIERKHNPEKVKYLDPRMKDILDQSFGVITYQDDVMMISIKLAGYSWLEADKLRKAMGKKIPAEMEAQKSKLFDGFEKHGLTKAKAEKLWHLIEPFAAYGFNKAHAASYGRVAYQTAYMKANFPAVYMAAVLTAESGDIEKISEIVAECKRMKLELLPPSINQSFAGFTVVREDGTTFDAGEKVTAPIGTEKIRFGLYTIKNFGQGIGDIIIEERKQHGKFISISDFLCRIKDKNMNKKSLESLIKVGALDDFAERGLLVGNLEHMLEYNKEQVKQAVSAQDSLFGGLSDSTFHEVKLSPAQPASMPEKLMWEKELLGLYISGHPLDKFKDMFAKTVSIAKMKESSKEGMEQVVGGLIEELREIRTQKGDLMAFIKIADMTGSFEIVAFPKTYTQFKPILALEKCVAIKGKISERNGALSMIADKVKELK